MDKINFADCDVEEMVSSAKTIVETMLDRKVGDADPIMLLLKSFISIIAYQRQIIDEAANQNLLYYATGKNLEAIGQLVGVKRLPAAAATCHVELTLSAPLNKVVNIPAGIRFNAGDNVNFKLDEDVTFLAGETVKQARAVCMEVGEVGNGYAVGSIKNIVDVTPYLASVRNITTSELGADEESDDSLRYRIQVKPESFSVAGSEGAYCYWCKEFSAEVIDTKAISFEPGHVTVFPLLKGGQIPGEEFLADLQDYLSADSLRPLTDYVHVLPPGIVEYEIDCDYNILREDKHSALTIQENAEKAVQDFISFTKNKISRDIDPTELYYRLRAAGCVNVQIRSPVFTEVGATQVAICSGVNLQYRGLKDI